MKNGEKDLPSEVYTTEAGQSRKKARADRDVPDPSDEDGLRAIEENTVGEDGEDEDE